jgi:hypothetical protein
MLAGIRRSDAEIGRDRPNCGSLSPRQCRPEYGRRLSSVWRTHHEEQHWQDRANLLLGIGIFFSPWAIWPDAGNVIILGYAIVGIAITFLAFAALVAFQPWEEWANLVLGVWLLVSPWSLGFSNMTALMWDAVPIGALTIVCACCALSEKRGGNSATH